MSGLRPALSTLIFLMLITGGAYPLLTTALGQWWFPHQANGSLLREGQVVRGSALIGQHFTAAGYFQGRPSAVGYNAASTGGSNKGPSNPDYLAEVQARIDTFLVYNPGVKKEEIPSDLVTASGGGLDPHISPQGAYIQISRVAKARNISEEKLKELVRSNIEKPMAGLFGTERVNVLKLNMALDNLK